MLFGGLQRGVDAGAGRAKGPPPRGEQRQAGFSERTVDGEAWRIYTIENTDLGVRVMVGDSIWVRDHLVSDVIKGLVLPAGLILPILAGGIWVSVRRGMAPLNDMADTLSSRPATDLRPLPDQKLPSEIAPAVHALNGLFRRVADAREREKSFTAFAAHELKTPLAGLKTQAQIALASSDGDVHANALRQISAGVDRTSRLVRQLLAARHDRLAQARVGRGHVHGPRVGGEHQLDILGLYGLAAELAHLADREVARGANRETKQPIRAAVGHEPRRYLPDPKQRFLQHSFSIHRRGERAEALADHRLGACDPMTERLRVARRDRGVMLIKVDQS